MTTATEAPAQSNGAVERDRLGFWAVLLSSAIVPLPMLAGAGIEAAFDAINPAGVDVRQPLAYLRELLGYGFGVLALLLLAIAVVCALLYRHRGAAALRLPVAIIVTQVVMGVGILYLASLVDSIETAYMAGR